jgi:hypothetical protein
MRKDQIGGDKTTGKEARDCDQGRQLKIRESRYGVAGSAASGISRPESDEKAADNNGNKSSQGKERIPIEHFMWRDSGKVVDPELRQGKFRLGGKSNVVRRSPMGGDETADQDAGCEEEIPKSSVLPVVPEILWTAWDYGGADVPQIARNSKYLIPDEQKRWNEKPDDRTR